MSAYKPLFLSEAAEHLDNLERNLLDLERRPGDEECLHEAFRHLHSIKGMAGSMGYRELSALAHGLEDLLVPFRQEKKPVAGEVVAVLLRGLDQLRRQLSQVSSGGALEPAGQDLLQAIARLQHPRGSASAAPAGAEATRRLQVEIAVSNESPFPAARAYLALRRLQQAGRVLRSTPPPEDLRQGVLPQRLLRVLMESREGLAELGRRLDLPEIAAVRWLPAEDPAPPAAAAAPPQTAAAPVSAAAAPAPMVRVSAELLDFFVDAVGELLAQRSHLEELAECQGDGELSDSVRALSQIVRRLHDRVMEVRLVPVSLLTDRLPRVCRDIAASRGKKVRLMIEGQDVPIDRALVETLDTPLLHLLRNALDHGIEPPDERLSLGKPEEGLLRISVRRRHDRVQMEVRDDGRGIDAGRVLERARRLGLVPDGSAPDEAAALDLIFSPGFSTREESGEVSGRGVGLDVVRTALNRLGGRVSVESRPGEGTAFILDLPLTLAVLQVLLVESAGRLLAVPASRVLRVLPLRPSESSPDGAGMALSAAGEEILYRDLGRLLQEPARDGAREAVIVGDGEQGRLALGVDRVAGHREVVQKPPGNLLRRAGPFAGTTVLGDGRPVLILDLDVLIERAARTGGVG